MKNLILLTVFLAFITCRNTVEIKEKVCQQYDKGTKQAKIDSSRNGLGFEGFMTRGNLNKVVNMMDFDTIYRYRGSGGWGEFDYICSIYRQMDTPQYKVQLLRQNTKSDTMYDISEKNLSIYEWQYLRKRFEESNYWCYGIFEETNYLTDASMYSVRVKEKSKMRNIVWRENEHFNDKLRGLGMDMLELADYPMPYAKLFYKKENDSIHIDMIPSDFDINFMKKYDFRHNLKGGKFLDGVYQLTIHKKDFAKLNDIELVTEFYNGKIRTTTEKKIEKSNF